LLLRIIETDVFHMSQLHKHFDVVGYVMRPLLLILTLLTSSFFAKANMDCIWTSHKAGITINYVSACNFENQSTVDSILNRVISLMSRRDTSLKIWVSVSQGQLSFPDKEFSNFFSIGYDTLREIDNDFIFNYYQNTTILSEEANNGINRFDSRLVPIDVNSTNSKSKSIIGIKIIYDRDYRIGEPVWTDIINAIVYAAKNLQVIKSTQKRDTVRYNTNGWYVSLLTIDTFAINQIIGRQSETQKKETAQQMPKSKNDYWLFGLLGLTAIGVIIYVARQYSR
jgi:hypothetical protein